jgi:small subunit ribosomal protein S9
MVAVKKTDKINGDALGTGRRKSSVARVRVRAGSGQITVNNKPIDEYFALEQDRNAILEVLNAVGHREDVDVVIRVNGGGTSGQAGACRMGLARAIFSYDEETFDALREGSFLTRDSRMKERKKPGLHGARRGTQFSKR